MTDLPSLGAWIVSISGTPTGQTLALVLALVSALAHATFGALQKGRHDPWLVRGAIDFWFLPLMLPVVLWVVPWPEPRLWPVLGGVIVIHFVYKWLIAMAYQRGSYVTVYPVVRGTGPVATVLFAMLVFGETYAPLQLLGVLLLSGAIISLALYNIGAEAHDVPKLRRALGLALAGGLAVAVYTTYDAWGIRLADDPFTFLAWFFLVSSFDFPPLALWWWWRMPDRPPAGPLLARGLTGALIALVSFGGVMLATRLDKVGEAAALRETSVVFAALIGWLVLGETVGPRRTLLMVLIALGAVLVEFG